MHDTAPEHANQIFDSTYRTKTAVRTASRHLIRQTTGSQQQADVRCLTDGQLRIQRYITLDYSTNLGRRFSHFDFQNGSNAAIILPFHVTVVACIRRNVPPLSGINLSTPPNIGAPTGQMSGFTAFKSQRLIPLSPVCPDVVFGVDRLGIYSLYVPECQAAGNMTFRYPALSSMHGFPTRPPALGATAPTG